MKIVVENGLQILTIVKCEEIMKMRKAIVLLLLTIMVSCTSRKIDGVYYINRNI